jgi:glucose/arabinose dehydrogenase
LLVTTQQNGKARALLALGLALLGLSCPGSSTSGGGGGGGGPPLALAFDPVGGVFAFPVFLTSPPGDARLFVVEKGGTIRIVENGSQLATPFLDVSGLLSSGGEQGLLGLAFDPSYATSGRFYVDYTDPLGGSVIARYSVSTGDPDVADAGSGEVVLTYVHTLGNHNGGMLAFGPDGMLYISAGDGGDQNEGPTLNDLLGAVLRIDVSGASGYAIPADNPFAGGGGLPEIWSYGLRNPWRMSFDRLTGDLYIGDVGQSNREEIDVATAATGTGRGANFGWNVMEGTACNSPPSGCSSAGTTLPVFEYDHSLGCSVIGGFVYRGAAIPALRGAYFYGDYCAGEVRSFRYVSGVVTDHQLWSAFSAGHLITGFGEDAAGELYVLTQGNAVYLIVQG